MRRSAHASERRALVSVHPLARRGSEKNKGVTPTDSVPPPPRIGTPPPSVSAAFDTVEPALWCTIAASIPNDREAVEAWIIAQDATTQAVLTCLSHAFRQRTSLDSIEHTLREAMDDELRDTPQALHEDTHILASLVAIAHARTRTQKEDEAQTEKVSSTTISTKASPPPSPPPTSPNDSQPRLVEMAPIVPLQSRPPPFVPRHELMLDSNARVDHYGFLYGMSVSEYWLHQGMEFASPALSSPSSDTLSVTGLSFSPSATDTMSDMDARIAAIDRDAKAESLPDHMYDMHEQQESMRREQWDAFLADIHTPSVQGADAEPETVWHNMFLALRASSEAARSRDARRFLSLCERGIPMAYRPAVWAECTRARVWAEPGVYADLHASAKCDRQIAMDVYRTMPTNLFFGGHGPGVPKLRRILSAYAAYNTDCGYCQGMNNLAAILLLTYTNEEDAFWALVGLTHTTLPPAYYASNMLAPRADQLVLMQLVQAGMPKLVAHMTTLGVELPAVTFPWFLSMFTACLPIDTLFRVWDMLLIEGHIVLFRVAYAILQQRCKALQATHSAAAFYQELHTATTHMYDADELITTCISLREKIRAQDVSSRRAKCLKALRDTDT